MFFNFTEEGDAMTMAFTKFKLWKNTSANLEGLPLQFHFHSPLLNIVLRGPSA